MNLLIGSLSKNGKIAYYEDEKCLWEMKMNCPKYITSDGEYYYTYSQGDELTLYSLVMSEKKFIVRSTITINETTCSHLCYSKKHNMLYCSCMDSGYCHGVEVIDGVFKTVKFSIIPGNIVPSKCHQVILNKLENTAIVVNILRNKIFFYDIVEGFFKENDYMELNGDVLPRHVMYSENEEVLYLVTEKSNEIIVLDYKNKCILQRQPIVLEEMKNAQGATIQIDNDTKILYACIRGNNVISSFKIEDNHTLIRINQYDMYGENARHMLLSHDYSRLVAANIKSNNFTVISVKTKKLIYEIEFKEAVSAIEVI